MKKYILTLLLFLPFVTHGAYFNSVSIGDNGYLNKTVEITPMNQIRTAETYRLVGSAFIDGVVGTAVDPNFWATTTVTTASTSQTYGEVIMNTGTTANASTSLSSVRKARYVGGASQIFRTQVRLGDTGTTNNLRRWGAYNATDGAFFQLSTTTLSVCTRRASVDSCTEQTSWNGGKTFTLDTNINTYEIYYTNKNVWFVVNDMMVHKHTATTQTWCSDINLKVGAENGNYNGGTSNVFLYIQVASISRMGPLKTNPIYYHTATAVTKTLKFGAGQLHGITINNPGGAGDTISIYDDTSVVASNLVATIAIGKTTQPMTLTYNDGIPLNNGLTIVTVGTTDITVMSE